MSVKALAHIQHMRLRIVLWSFMAGEMLSQG
jgi:hypothetical protein